MTREEAARVAHDLKTPLAAIIGNAQLISQHEDEALRADAVERILLAAEQLARSIDVLIEPLASQG